MFRFPDGYLKIRYPGYAWSISEKKLYTFKGGLLKEMRLRRGYRGYSKFLKRDVDIPPGYQISHEGERHLMPLKE